MADKKRIYADKTELILMFLDGNEYKTTSLNRDQIIRIQFDKYIYRKFLIKVDTEKIQIVTKKRSKPIEYIKSKEKKYFNEYKNILEEYAKENRVTFINNTNI